jgi:hypothetical protein
MIPISFEPPADYRVVATDYDNGVSLYTLASATRGDVVLAMYYEGGQQADAAATDAPAEPDAAAEPGGSLAAKDEVIIDGTAVPAKIDEAYMLLSFEREGLCYTLSSRDDMGVLAAFYRSIVRLVP